MDFVSSEWTHYDLSAGLLTMGMDTYIKSTMDRFLNFDLTLGFPYREIVGCLLWIVLCVVGPGLVRVKDLAKRSNSPTLSDYQAAVKVLKRIYKRRSAVIVYKRGYAGRELVPSQTRPESSVVTLASTVIHDQGSPSVTTYVSQDDVLLHFSEMPSEMDLTAPTLPTTSRFTTVAYTDASFAVGEFKISISGYTIFVNCTPVMWGSIQQTTNVDSTCSSEFVAASVCCKQLILSTPIRRPVSLLPLIANEWEKIRHIQI
jgi:hypothetical protein